MRPPPTKYAKAGDVSIAYQVVGEGPLDLVLVPGFATHLELGWEMPGYARFVESLASFSRLILFDKRGTGLSDPVARVPSLEERIDDVTAVMGACGSEQAALFGVSEGGAMSALFAATHPERVRALVLYGAMARTTEAPDYPWAPPADGLMEAGTEFIGPSWGQDGLVTLEIFQPSSVDIPGAVEKLERFHRGAASPSMVFQIFEMFLNIDIRDVLPSVQVPTLVIHREHDLVVNRRAGRWLAEQIPGARYLELPGKDHIPWSADMDPILDATEEFLTGTRGAREPERVLSTVMFTDVVGSTQRAAEIGDAPWAGLLGSLQDAIRASLERNRGHEVKTLGDGMLATFDGPARAVRCGREIAGLANELGLELRTGIHTGEIELLPNDVGGIAVHIASRIGDLAETAEVLVSSTVKDLVVGSGLKFAERGEHELKSVPGEWRLFAAGN